MRLRAPGGKRACGPGRQSDVAGGSQKRDKVVYVALATRTVELREALWRGRQTVYSSLQSLGAAEWVPLGACSAAQETVLDEEQGSTAERKSTERGVPLSH